MTQRREEPRYRTLAAELAAAITRGDYGADAKLPSESALADQFAVSRGTVRHAMSVLRASGMITSRRGTRRRILDTAPTQGFLDLISFSRWARSIGEDPGARTVSMEQRPATAEEADQLRLPLESPVWSVLRLRTLGGRPLMLERTAYRLDAGDALVALAPNAPSHVDPLLRDGMRLADTEHLIDVAAADDVDAEHLGCPVGTGLLRERRRSTDEAGVPMLISDDRFLPGTVTFAVHNSTASTPLSRRLGAPLRGVSRRRTSEEA